ncbi:hypothetical protein BT63DRAFT_214945 [Microthyrium microscopicum]|uniref:Uncharacterized protein n=1 Tax=Microthyrium microscopicum TaxID=703497 RepID=A0A6A6UJV3_9PEZI|nr:hypothetical protein BT63DRAFT_214945 [Microthyrium microscopicum]
MPGITFADTTKGTYTPIKQHSRYDSLVDDIDTKLIISNHPSDIQPDLYTDIHTDPFSDDNSLDNTSPTSPLSPQSHGPSARDISDFDPNDPLTPLRTSLINCCRCPHSQPVLAHEDDEPVADKCHAVCDRCTHSFCRKCTIDTDSVISFDANRKAPILQDASRLNYFWSCASCGLVSSVPVSRIKRSRGSVSVDLKGLKCVPCNQKTNGMCLVVATINQMDTEFMPSPSLERTLDVLAEEEESSDGASRPGLVGMASENMLPRAKKMASPGEMKRHSSWSIKSLKRWASMSSMRTV